jgi:N-acyl amino acid synthase FeeM
LSTVQEPIVKPPPSTKPYLGPVQNCEDFAAAFTLLYRNYVQAGYCDENPTGMHIPPFALHPDTVVFVARNPSCQSITSTLSIMPDSPLGLPADSAFEDAMNALRAEGRRIVEVGMLADRRSGDRPSAERRSFGMSRLGYLLDFFKYVNDYARVVAEADELCVTVHPHHVLFYRRYMGFKVMAETRPCGAVKDNPAVLLRLDMQRFSPDKVRAGRLRELLLGAETPLKYLTAQYAPTPKELGRLLRSCPQSEEPAETVRQLATVSAASGLPMPHLVRCHAKSFGRRLA